MAIEAFRPFAPPQALATQGIPVLTTKVQKNAAVLTWGNTAGRIPSPTKDTAGPAFKGRLSFKTKPTDSDWVETSRQVQPVKVVNPKDASQYVVVAQTVAKNVNQPAMYQPGGPLDPDYNYNMSYLATTSGTGGGTAPDAPGIPTSILNNPNAGDQHPGAYTSFPNGMDAPSNSYETNNPAVMAQVLAATEQYYADLDDAPPGPIGPVITINNAGAGQPPGS